jgi:hypothetical protein
MRLAIGLLSLFMIVGTTFVPQTAHAQSGQVPIRIDGVWDPPDNQKDVLMTLNMVSAKQHTNRKFGVTMARTMDPVNTGTDVFQQAIINPGIVVFGRDKETASFFTAPAGKKIQILGTYWVNEGDLILGSVTFSK